MLAGAARAEVVETGPQGFRLRSTADFAAPPEKVYRSIGEVQRWWSDAHTYSGKASNMRLPLAPNACFCEAIPPDGGVRHGIVVLANPNSMVRIDGALGPLQDEGVAAALFFEIKPKGSGSEVVMTYNVGGARERAVTMAPMVDKVLSEQFARLKKFVETGAPQ
jgi:hypothetical protein